MGSFASQISFVLLLLQFATTFDRSVVMSNEVIRSCHENDQRLLLIFKQGVLDPNNQLSSWTVEEDCCSWEGVYCNNITRRVTELSLFNYTLGGEINLCVLQLEFLNHLDLSYNDFKTVSMPPCQQISKSSFDAHKFGNQSLTTTPSNHSASFSVTLRYLNFSENSLVINDLLWLAQLSSLKYLDLSHNSIGNETKWLQHMAMIPSLSELRLRDCGLRDFPPMDYVNFTSLEVLDLSNNYYMKKTKLPKSFFNVTKHIYHLDLGGCHFYGQLPNDVLLNLQNLEHLVLSFNELEGSIPDWLGQYERLQYLDIRGNLFSGVVPSSLGNVSSLFYLDLSYNQLSGNLPKSLGQLYNLNHLGIGSNFFAGILTEKNFWNLSNLNSLDLSSTSFEFDTNLAWVPPFQLEYLDMGNTSIGPNVPPWLYTQQSLEYLDISRSRISRIDADVFWSLIAGISYVDLSGNMISDDISNVTLLANISYLYASHNSLSGSIFSLLCQLGNKNRESMLYYLDLSYNHLSGTLPDCWANCKRLEYLNLGSNKLTGKIPPSLASLSLDLLDLSDNSLFGKFSVHMLNWTYLQYLVLEKNNFSGSLPNFVAKDLIVMQLRDNQFMDSIPLEMCMLSSLMVLDLANNKLSGSIPHCLYNVTHPKHRIFWPSEIIHIHTKGRELDYQTIPSYLFGGIIDMSANHLSGEIPKELFNITLMWSLNLSQNYLTGKIPKEIGGSRNLECLDLSYNRLFGKIPSTISNLSFLDHLNLSYNNFIGQIPLGTQIQSFDSWSFVGNHELCGDPLPKKCNKKEETHDDSNVVEGNDEDDFLKSLYLGMGVGFAMGFWGVCGSLFLVRVWRHKFFQWYDHLVDRLYVTLALCFKRFD